MEREIIPIADELATDALAGNAERFKHFVVQWDIETMPACDVGMALLMDLAESHPIAYEMAWKQGFANLTHPIFQKLKRWTKFADHYTVCLNCNEYDPKLQVNEVVI